MKLNLKSSVATLMIFLTACGGGEGGTGAVNEPVTVTGTATSGAIMTVTGTATGVQNPNGTVTVTGPVTVNAPVTVTGMPSAPVTVSTGSNGNVTGTPTAPVTVTGTVSGPITVSGQVTVTGTSTSTTSTGTVTATVVDSKGTSGTATIVSPATPVSTPTPVVTVPVTATPTAPVATAPKPTPTPVVTAPATTTPTAPVATAPKPTPTPVVTAPVATLPTTPVATAPVATPTTTPTTPTPAPSTTVTVTVTGPVTGPVTVTGTVKGPVTVVSSTPITASTTVAPQPTPANVAACPLPSTITGNVATAVKSGNALGGATTDDYLTSVVNTIELQRNSYTPIIAQLYNLNSNGTAKSDGSSITALTWDPSHDSARLQSSFGANADAIIATATASGGTTTPVALAVAGVSDTNSRYMVMASNPMRTMAKGSQMEKFFVNSIQWLTGKTTGTALKVALVQLDDSYWFRDESTSRTWLTAQYGSKVSFNAANAYDGANLSKILIDGADLVIVSQQLDAGQNALQVRNGIKALIDAGIPVLYVHLDGGLTELGSQLLDLFKVSYIDDNYWTKAVANSLDGSTLVGRLPAQMVNIRETATRLKSGTYSFTLAQVSANQSLPTYQTEFLLGTAEVQKLMAGYDAKALNIFNACGAEVPKLLALTGDRIRQDVVFPLSVAKSTPKDFLRALYADHAVYNARSINPAQKDLGTFSRTDFSKVTPVIRTISMVSRPSFRGTGAYAMPGKTVKITRLDTNAVATSVWVNTLRSGTTKLWDDNDYGGYSRPKFLRSNSISIKPGETIYLTSPYGGPLQVGFDVKDVTVQFKFENVSEHAYWSSPADDATFAAKLAANTHDWVEIATDGFEMHSKAERFTKETLADPNWNTPAALAAATQRYTYNYTHILAGFQGDGIDKDPEVFGWASTKGLTLPTTNEVKHMNADVPLCGYGCSGNPYDAGWGFSPIGHGDLHELGHSLQTARWQLKHGSYSYANHAGTNFYAYYAQSRAFDEKGALDGGRHGMPFQAIYGQLQAAYQSGDRAGSVSTVMEKYFSDALAGGGDSGIDNSYAFYTQFMMQARKKGLLNIGWHMLGRIHVIERSFNAALKDQATWDAEKSKFGFDQIAFADAKAMSNNDFMAVAMSFSTGLDVRDYMAMWGFRINSTAANQIAGFNLPAAERVYFAMDWDGWARGALTNKVSNFTMMKIDGTTAWPKVP